MSKKSNHNADISNPNKGTSGTNITYDKNQGNRGKQLNPNLKEIINKIISSGRFKLFISLGRLEQLKLMKGIIKSLYLMITRY